MKCQEMSSGSCGALSTISCEGWRRQSASLRSTPKEMQLAAPCIGVSPSHLHIVLSKHALPSIVCLPHGLRWLGLADGDEAGQAVGPPRPRRRRLQPPRHLRSIAWSIRITQCMLEKLASRERQQRKPRARGLRSSGSPPAARWPPRQSLRPMPGCALRGRPSAGGWPGSRASTKEAQDGAVGAQRCSEAPGFDVDQQQLAIKRAASGGRLAAGGRQPGHASCSPASIAFHASCSLKTGSLLHLGSRLHVSERITRMYSACAPMRTLGSWHVSSKVRSQGVRLNSSSPLRRQLLLNCNQPATDWIEKQAHASRAPADRRGENCESGKPAGTQGAQQRALEISWPGARRATPSPSHACLPCRSRKHSAELQGKPPGDSPEGKNERDLRQLCAGHLAGGIL